MKRHIDPETLQDLAEGLLGSEAEARARKHLQGCASCRGQLRALETLMEDMAALPKEGEPSRDLWPQIAWRIEGSRREDPAESPEAPGKDGQERDGGLAGGGSRRRVSLPAWQLLAAGIALVILSGGSVWAFLSSRSFPSTEVPPGLSIPAQMVGWEEAYVGYDEAVEDLEGVLEKGREVLDPQTVRVLEESLRTIDGAIEEARDAVRRDPASPLLQRFLADNLRKKMELLRRAAMAVYANT